MNRFLRSFLPLMLSLLFAGFAYGQTGTVKGVVRDKLSGETLPGTNVLLKGTLTGASTDFDGQYTLNNVPAAASPSR